MTLRSLEISGVGGSPDHSVPVGSHSVGKNCLLPWVGGVGVAGRVRSR